MPLASLQTRQGVSFSSSRSHTAGILDELAVNLPRRSLTVCHPVQIRLITMTLGGESYLNFMGNEFGCAPSLSSCHSEAAAPKRQHLDCCHRCQSFDADCTAAGA